MQGNRQTKDDLNNFNSALKMARAENDNSDFNHKK